MRTKELSVLSAILGTLSISAFLTGCGSNNSSSNSSVVNVPEINSVSVLFYDGYNYSTGQAMQESGDIHIPEYTFTLDSEKTEEFRKIYSGMSELKESVDQLFSDEYKIVINDDIECYCDQSGFFQTSSPYTVYESKQMVSFIEEITEEYKTENVYLDTLKCGVKSVIYDGEPIEVTDDINNTITQCRLSRVDIDKDYNEYGTVETVVTLQDNNVLLLFKDKNRIGYVDSKDGGCYVVINGPDNCSLSDYLSNTKYNSANSLGAADGAKITVSYNGKSFDADEALSSEIIRQSKSMEYSQYNWLTKDYDMGKCIEVNIENGIFYIPTDKTIGNRYYKDKNGDIYMVLSFGNDVEKSLFELVGEK